MHPGKIDWTNGVTLSRLIGLAGGLTKAADPSRIMVYREGAVETLSYMEATNSPNWDLPFYGGARIVVPCVRATNTFAPPGP